MEGLPAQTTTSNVQLPALAEASVAVQLTGVVPGGKVLPEAGVQVLVTPGQLSVALNVQVTGVALGALETIVAGQLISGFSVSLTVTVKLQLLVLPLPSVAVQVTVLTPFGKVEPLAGLQLVVTFVQLSLAVGTYVSATD